MSGDQDNRVASGGACIRCGTFCYQEIGFRWILCRKGRYCAEFAREFNKAPIRASTCGVGMVVDFVGTTNVARDTFLGMVIFGSRTPCTQNDCVDRTCATCPHESGSVDATAVTTTVLRSSLRNFGHDRLVGRRICRVGGIIRVCIRCGHTASGSICIAPLVTLVATTAATTAAVS